MSFPSSNLFCRQSASFSASDAFIQISNILQTIRCASSRVLSSLFRLILLLRRANRVRKRLHNKAYPGCCTRRAPCLSSRRKTEHRSRNNIMKQRKYLFEKLDLFSRCVLAQRLPVSFHPRQGRTRSI